MKMNQYEDWKWLILSGLCMTKKWSGWRDLNSRPFVPQTNALTRLRYIPIE